MSANGDIFVSYSHKDAEWVNGTLLPHLEAWGLSVIIDNKNFLPGSRLASTLRHSLRSSRHVVFVCTKDFIASEWCCEEIETVRAEDPASLKRKAIPVVLDSQSVPDLLSDIVWCDLSKNPYDQNEWKKLCQSMQGVWIDNHKEIQTFIRSAIDAEFQAYKSLPTLGYDGLKELFNENGSAYQRIKNLLLQHHDRGWIISNPENPSAVLLLDIAVEQASPMEYKVLTTEYWYLRWYSITEKKYRLIYNETNDQVYIIKKIDDALKIEANIYPKPRRGTFRRLEYMIRKFFRTFLD